MLKGYICPDGKQTDLDDCLNKPCRMGERCMTVPTLALIAEEREWNGVASTTQLISGTMETYLKLTEDYYIDPDSRTFMLAGTKHHKGLEDKAKELGLPAEVAMSGDRDIIDLIEYEDGGFVLTDYKLWGSYKVASALGIVQVGKEPDPSGEVYKRSGKWGKAGDPKLIPVWGRNPDEVDKYDVTLQLNRYRVMWEAYGVTVAKMRVQATVRDGGTITAKNRGVLKNSYMIPIEPMDNSEVEDYFQLKDDQIHYALENGWNTPCNQHECWQGRKCEDYCDVAFACPRGQTVLAVGNKGG